MRSSIAILAAAVTLTGCATVQDTFRDSRLASPFTQVDADRDGVISSGEAQASDGLRQNFQRLDTNRSAGISKEEYEAATVKLVDIEFNTADVNGDGIISEREAGATPASLREAFKTVDSDRDGNVSSIEYQAARTNLLQQVDLDSIDRDGDGVIDKNEVAEVPALFEVYGRADLDGDGFLNAQELRAARR
jgi:Ca2+-binding EF-hand superfamily protein